MLLGPVAAHAAIPVHGDIITNVANVSSTLGIAGDSVDVRALGRTPALMNVYAYAPGGATVATLPVNPTECALGGGGFSTLPPPQTLSGTSLALPATLNLIAANVFKLGNPLFINVSDPDQNINPSVSEQILVDITTAGGDVEQVRLVETGPDTGVFNGYIQTVSGAANSGDCVSNALAGDTLTITYTDSQDGSDVEVSSVLVDPYGLVFDSSTGAPIDGVSVTLIDTATGNPATVYGDDGVSLYPATVTTGGSVSDSSGTNYNFPAGGYRFPLVAPGTYRLQVTPAVGYVFPTTVTDAILQTLPGAPFALIIGSRGEDFVIPAGPPVQIDVALDPAPAAMFLSKTTLTEQAMVGEFVPYSLELSNSASGITTNVAITDTLPAGFRFQRNSLFVDGIRAGDPVISADGRTLTFNLGTLAAGQIVKLNYVALVSTGARGGKATNTAQANGDADVTSNIARAVVQVNEDPIADRARVLGRIMTGNCAVNTEQGDVDLVLRSRAEGEMVVYTATVSGRTVPVTDLAVLIDLPQAIGYVAGSSTRNGSPTTEPVASGGGLRFLLGDYSGQWTQELSFAVKAAPTGIQDLGLLVDGSFKLLARAEFSTASSGHTRTPVAENTFHTLASMVWPKFDALTAVLRTTDKKLLDDIVRQYRKQKVLRLHVKGHTDSKPISAANQKYFQDNYELALERARSVANYLREKFNLTQEQMSIEGIGPDQPISTNDTEEGRQLNRRVEVEIETEADQTRSRFKIISGDSGHRSVQTLGATGEMRDPDLGMNAPGVSGIRLLMEDGRYAVTDDRGMYHFDGLQPGTHVIQVDPASIPAGYELFHCEANTRIAGSPHSRFIDLQAGTLWRSDFYLRPKNGVTGSIGLSLNSELRGETVAYSVQLQGDTIPYDDVRLVLELAEGMELVSDAVTVNGQAATAVKVNGQTVEISLGPRKKTKWRDIVDLSASITAQETAELITRAKLVFDTFEAPNQVSTEVDNAIKVLTSNSRSYSFKGRFTETGATLAQDDIGRLEQIVTELKDQPVMQLLVSGFESAPRVADAGERSASKALAEERAAAVAGFLSSRLSLFDNQVRHSGNLQLDGSVTAVPYTDGHVDILVTLAGTTERSLQLSRNDSGFWSRSVMAQSTNPSQTTDSTDTDADSSQLGIINLADGHHNVSGLLNVVVRMDSQLKAVLLLDGQEVSKNHIAMTKTDSTRGTTLISYIGIPVQQAGAHILGLKGIGPFGNTRFEDQRQFIRTGSISALEVVETSGNLADAKTPVTARIRILDENGTVVPIAMDLELREGNLRPPAETAQALPEIRQAVPTVQVDRDGYIRFAPVTDSGRYTAVLAYNDIELPLEIQVKPHFRDWVMVGVAEGTAAYNNLSGNMDTARAQGEDNGFYHDGRLALYAKGQIKGKWLLTMAYDSGKSRDKVDDGLYQIIDPEKYYTLYGDTGSDGNDAPSRRRLYIRLAAEEYYVLFGDYETGFSVTELSRYSRSLTGLKSEYSHNGVNVTAFLAQAEQAFVRDEIPGDGTSGLYRLSRGNIVINSDKVILETRDRFHSEQVISSRELARHLDYNIDTADGTLYFKEPVYSRDENFNPVYIVAEYEVENDNREDLAGGLRASTSLLDKKLEIGATVINDDTEGAKSRLLGTDIKFNPDPNTQLRAEWASTDSNANSQDRSGSAWLTEIRRRNDRYQARAYARKLDDGFGLGQQAASEIGTSKYGIDANYKLRQHLTLRGEAWHEQALSTDKSRDVFDFDSSLALAPYTLNGGFRIARDTDAIGNTLESDLLTGGVARSFIGDHLKLRANGEVAVGDHDNPDYPSRFILGGDYRLTPQASVTLEQEYTDGSREQTESTRVGIRAALWQDATVNSSVENQNTEYGPRTFSTIGLTQGLKISERFRLDFGIDRSQTNREPNYVAYDNNRPPASGPVSDEFTAISVGSTYKDKTWSATLRLETRDGSMEDKTGIILGFFRQQNTGLGFAATIKYFDSQRQQSDNTNINSRFALAYRPLQSRWIVLNQLDLVSDAIGGALDQKTEKLVDNLNANYMFNRRNQLAIQYGIRYAITTLNGQNYDNTTHVVGSEYRHDISRDWDIGVRGSTLLLTAGNSQKHSFGLSAGYNMARNIWISAGYNFIGFRDDDFSGAAYTAAGPFLKFRMSLDYQTARSFLAWWEK